MNFFFVSSPLGQSS